MEDPRMNPTARQRVGSEDIETSLTLSDLLALYDSTNTNERKATSLLTLMTSLLVRFAVKVMTANGAIDLDATSMVTLDKSGVLAATVPAPILGHLLIITQVDSGTDGHTVTLDAGTFDGTNEIATLNAEGETLVLVGLSATRFLILLNIGAVAFSTSG